MALREELKNQSCVLYKYKSCFHATIILVGAVVKYFYAPLIECCMITEMLKSYTILIGMLGIVIRMIIIGRSDDDILNDRDKSKYSKMIFSKKDSDSLVRNPLYFGGYMLWLSTALYTGSFWFVIISSLLFLIYYECIVYTEEEYFRKKYGSLFIKWSEITPPLLLAHANFRKSSTSFEWKRVLKCEKSLFFKLFLIFLIYSIVGNFSIYSKITIDSDLFLGTLLSGMFYLVIKFYERYTTCLDI